MNKLIRSARQLQSLTRLRAMQKAQSAVQLAEANAALSDAEQALHRAQARYRLALEVQRRNRANGQEIDPVLYAHQLDSTDLVRHTLLEQIGQHEAAQDTQQQAMTTFASHHSQHKVVQTAEREIRAEIVQQRQIRESIDSQDQAGRTHLITEQP